MKPVSANKSNRLLRCMVILSLGIHLVIFMHISGLHHSEPLSYIEMTVRDFSKPPVRTIPRPRNRTKTPELPSKVKRLTVQKRIIPCINTRPAPREKNMPDSIIENISMPELPEIPGLKVAKWQPEARIGAGDYMTVKEYYEMIRLRIETNKKYPKAARNRKIQGRSTVRFLFFPDGRAENIKIVTSSKNSDLDRAALDAVRDSSPFLRPPRSLFSEPVSLEITIIFELT